MQNFEEYNNFINQQIQNNELISIYPEDLYCSKIRALELKKIYAIYGGFFLPKYCQI